jgi:lysophospholipase L1-like esterase
VPVYETVVTDSSNVQVVGAKGYIYVDGVLADLTDDLGAPLTNPIVSDALGHAKATVGSDEFTVNWHWLGRLRLVETFIGALPADRNQTKRLRTLNVLADSIARTGGQLPAVMSVPPTIGTPTASTAIATGTTWELATANNHSAKYTFVGGQWGAIGATYPTNQAWRGVNAHNGDGTNPAATPLYGGRFRFSCEDPSFEFQMLCTGATTGDGFRLKVDGQYAKIGVIGNVGNGVLRFIPITFGAGAAADRKMRHFELEMGNTGSFMGIRTHNEYKPMPWPQADGLRVLQHGDSLVWTISDSGDRDTGLAGAMAISLGNLLGQADHIGSGVGGSGWLTPIVKDRNYFNDRVALDVVANAPDVIIEHGGGNDIAATPTQAAMQALVTTWLDTVITANPAVIIFMTGPLIASEPTAAHLTIAAAKQAAAALYPKNVIYIDNFTDKWVFGTGRQGATAANGNRDWVTGTDSAHPSMEGHVALAGRITRAVSGGIKTLIAAQG